MAQFLTTSMQFLLIFLLSIFHFLPSYAEGFKEKRTRYIDFQLYGSTFFEQNSRTVNAVQKRNTQVWTNSNLDIDFNFTENFGVATQTSILNRVNGMQRTYATIDYINSQQSSAFLSNTGLTQRVLAFHVHKEDTSVLFGKIHPRAGILTNIRPDSIDFPWAGAYGFVMNGGYMNSNKVGLEFRTQINLAPYSSQTFEVAIFKNDRSKLNNSTLANNNLSGYSMPHLNNLTSEREAGKATSFSLLFVNEADLIGEQNFLYSIYFRKQGVESGNAKLADENTVITSGQYSFLSGESGKFGVLGNVAYISNAHGVKSLREQYYTASAFIEIDSFNVALIYHKFNMNGNSDLGISSLGLSQAQMSLGYKFTRGYRVDVAYRTLKDTKTKNKSDGVSIVMQYSIGTKR